MTLDELIDQHLAWGMGWLGWTEDQALAATPDTIRLAKRGRVEMIDTVLRAVFGKPQSGHETLSGGHAPTAENFARAFAAIEKGGGL